MFRNIRHLILWPAILLGTGPALSASAADVAMKIGNPLLARYPATGDARPRSIWDLQAFDGKIYMASGDYWNNRGPVDIWTYAGAGTNFVNEYTTQEDMVWDFFVQDGTMFIPGVDARIESPVIANLYINDPDRNPVPGWLMQRTLTGGRHSFDVALFKSNLFASITLTNNTGRTLVSTDMGQTWTLLTNQYSGLVAFDDFLFLEGTADYVYSGQALRKVTPTLYVNQLAMARRARYRDGLLYSYPMRYSLASNPLYFITAAQLTNSGTATAVPAFTNDRVRDIVVRDDFCFVMTAEEIQADLLYRGRIYTSDDLTNWWLSTEFTVPGIPLSFEVLNNRFYVGIGSRFDGTNWSILTGPEAGSLWEIAPQAELGVLAPAAGNGIMLDVAVAPGLPFTIEATSRLEQPEWAPLLTTNVAGESFSFVDPDAGDAPIRYYRVFH